MNIVAAQRPDVDDVPPTPDTLDRPMLSPLVSR